MNDVPVPNKLRLEESMHMRDRADDRRIIDIPHLRSDSDISDISSWDVDKIEDRVIPFTPLPLSLALASAADSADSAESAAAIRLKMRLNIRVRTLLYTIRIRELIGLNDVRSN